MSAAFSSCLYSVPCVVLLFADHVLLAALLAEFMLGHGLKAPRVLMAGIALCFAVLFADVAIMASGYLVLHGGRAAGLDFATWTLAWPVGVHVAVAVAAGAFVLVAGVRLHRWRSSRITPGAVKEALDALPQGLCFADADGVPLLVNAQMERLSLALTGAPLHNAAAFWALVKKGDSSIDQRVSLFDRDGGAWLFTRRAMRLADGARCWQISADDVTVEHELGRELERRNERLRQMGERLRAFSRDAQEAIRQQEIVQARAMVHDETGRVLLATAHYLEHPDAGDAQAVLAQWQAMANLLLVGADADGPDGEGLAALDEVVQAAASIGMTVCIEGTLPASGAAARIALRALGEAVVNARRHADAREVALRVLPGDARGFLLLEFANDGIPPAAPIRETGGLATLRQQVEHAGGIMRVEQAPAFKLSLELPG